MSTGLADPTTALCGVPFLDDTFVSTRLLAAAAALRHVEAERAGSTGGIGDAQVEAWLAPARVFMLRRESPSMPAGPLTPARRAMIVESLAGVGATVPAWAPLLRLPVRFALLHPANGAISASSRAWPQHVLLADEAFASGRELREQVMHELCHQWLYLIEEVWPLEVPDAPDATLPSGTANRSPAEVLGAAHVAAVLIRMYQADTSGDPVGRVDQLATYGAQCLRLLDDLHNELTDAGRQVARRLKGAL